MSTLANALAAHDLQVGRVLSRLPARERAALRLRFWEGLSERQVADVLGCRHATVRRLVGRGLVRLRQQLARDAALEVRLSAAADHRPPRPYPLGR